MSLLTRRRRSLLHWLVSTCLVLAMIVQPVLASIGEMHELANLAVLLMGRGADYINGQTIAIDGAGYQANSGNFYQSLSRMDDQQWADMAAMIRGANAKDKAARTTG